MNSAMKLNKFATYAWAAVLYNLAVITWGAYVRATASGAGCGAHWPLCNGEVVPRAPQVETLIELTHRLTSGLSLVFVIALAWWAFRAFPQKHRVRAGAAVSLLFIVTEALVGAGLVLFKLVAGNASVMRALYMSVHLTNTFLLLAALTITAWWASGARAPRLKGQGVVAWMLVIGLVATLILGVSGAIAALGDTLFPSTSLAESFRQDFSQTAHILIRLRVLHPFIAVAVGCYLVIAAGLASFARPGNWTKRLTIALVVLILLQLGAGLLNVALLAPIWLQLVHLLLADLIWIQLVLLTNAALVHAAPQTGQVEYVPAHTAVET